MKWSVLYEDFEVYNYNEHNWEDLPEYGVQKIIVDIKPGYRIGFCGVDCYAIYGDRVIVWKEDYPDDPYNNWGQERIIKNGEISELEYKPKSTWLWLPAKYIKKGTMLDEETAKQMGIL